jgi:predicted secreted protein
MHRLVFALVIASLATAARAADGADAVSPPTVSVSASASANVPNDRLHAWLRAEAENASPAAAAAEVNARVGKAIARVKSVRGLTIETVGYTTQQVSDRGQPLRWRIAQTVSVEGSDFPAIAMLVAQLQDEDGLLLSGMTFAVSEIKRRETEDALTQQALAAWRERAQNAARGLGFSAWRPGRVTVATGDVARPRPVYRGGGAATAAAPAPVPLEAGATEVTVTVTGDAVLDSARTAPR